MRSQHAILEVLNTEANFLVKLIKTFSPVTSSEQTHTINACTHRTIATKVEQTQAPTHRCVQERRQTVTVQPLDRQRTGTSHR